MSFIFMHQKLNIILLFDALWHSWEQVIQFESNMMQTTTFTKLYHMA